MKNKFAFTLTCAILLAAILGCRSISPFSSNSRTNGNQASNKTLTDKGVDIAIGDETTGIPECDEVMDMIAAEVNNPDDGYIVKATKGLFMNKIKESIRTSIEENKNQNSKSTADLAKTCTDYKKQLIKYKTEEDQK